MNLLHVNALTKRYPAFTLDGVSFDIHAGEIVGFIGRNGAGKTTSLKSLSGLVHPDGGEITFFGGASESEVKQRVGFASGGIAYYPKVKLRTITDTTRRFYTRWDEDAYRRLMAEFSLDENKTPSELSEGMKVKYSLVLALSHGAELLILDEPTSGLDPFSRDELLEIFRSLRERGIGILYSTHIIRDLERTADRILYIRSGRIFGDAPMDDFVRTHRISDGESLEDIMLRMERESR
ncbi:MAG: ABC transporter ATP-binding protein [Ruminococcaceae bacterium]|nr:ABC transporter ATP-binding protein [Oscillospiraceae bacterium]